MYRIQEMWRLMLLAYFTTMVYSQQQNARRPEYDNGHGWDIRLAVPGIPGTDYPTLNAIPRTSFSCSGKSPGYYADVEAGCQVFRVCTLGSTYGFQSFLCPNGTLFNQQVLVCDWWMNAHCDKSRQLFNDNKDKFGNLMLGPQLMKDIKKMLTHPLRNPYDKATMKSNLIIMQDYKPPSGQLFPNGALISGPERLPSNVYVPAKQRQGNFAQNSFHSADLIFAATTPSSQYIPLSLNTIEPAPPRGVQVLQPQNQNLKLVQKGFSGTVSHTGNEQLSRNTNPEYINNRITQSSYSQQQNHNQSNKPVTQHISQNNQSRRQLSQYNAVPSNQIMSANQHQIFIGNANGQVRANSIPQFPRAANGNVDREAKQNLVSSNIIPPIGKTLKFSRIVQKSSTGNPKSRITFKTWIVRPSKSARLVVEPTPYSYNRPINDRIENILVDTTSPPIEKSNSEAEDGPYTYNRPILLNKQIRTTGDNPSIYLPPTEPTSLGQLYSTSKIPKSSKQTLSYLAPTTYKPSFTLSVPPGEDFLKLSRQYLNPNLQSPQTINYHSARLVATPTAPTIDFTTAISSHKKAPPISFKKHHDTYNNHNLTFSDILTREKLDITVNDIVKDTNKLLNTASRDELSQYRENNKVADNLTSNNVSPEFKNYNYDQLTVQPTSNSRSEKIIAAPSIDLEPPADTSPHNYENTNKFSNLPFFKESLKPSNTFERTVSLKITIPEKIAQYIFNKDSGNDIDNLEILNTGSSNYLVLTNNNLEENKGAGFIPIGKLIWDKNINISNSQALVYSFLTDSLNAVKEYSNIAKQSITSPVPTQQIQNLNNEVIDDITDKVSQLTSSQFSNDNQNRANLVLLPQKTRSSTYFRDNIKYETDNLQQPMVHNQQESSQFSQQKLPEQLYSSQLQWPNTKNVAANLQGNSHQLYSGQLYKLPVPEVTRQINNFQNSIQSSNARLTEPLATTFSHRDVHRDISANNIRKQSNKDVEIIPSETLPYPPARQPLQGSEATINTHEHSENIYIDKILNTDNGITAQIQDKIIGTLPHPLEGNKVLTYKKNKSYYLYSELENNNNNNIQATNTIDQTSQQVQQQNTQLTGNNDLSNRVTFELFPSIGYQLENEREKQQIFNALKIKDYEDSSQDSKTQDFNQRTDLVTGVDYTIIHPTSKTQFESPNNINTILYRGPSSYLAPPSTVGSLRANQEVKSISNSRLEKFDDTSNTNNNNGYSKDSPVRQFSF